MEIKDQNSNESTDIQSSKDILFTEEEQKLIKKYLEEYNDIFQKILIYSKEEFFSNLNKRVKKSEKLKNHKISKSNYQKIEDYIMENLYKYDFKCSLIVKNTILQTKIKKLNQYIFEDEIIPHCDFDKNSDGLYIHSCGEIFYYVKFKRSSTEKTQILLYCIKCNLIYKSSMIKFKCAKTGIHFYSKIMNSNISNENNSNEECYATWKKYHCNAIINDCMKCQNCNKKLYFLKNDNRVYCKNCNINSNPKDIIWKCLICKKDFTSEAKIYNPLEYKALKICVKDAIINQIPALPKYMNCKCGFEIKNETIFFHKINCKGNLYLGDLNDEKVVVCDKCDSLGIYNDYIWTCPKCFHRFKNNEKNDIGKINNEIEFSKSRNKNIDNFNGENNKSENNNNLKKEGRGNSNDPINNSSMCKNTKYKKFVSYYNSKIFVKMNKLERGNRTSSSVCLNNRNQLYLNHISNINSKKNDYNNQRNNKSKENLSMNNLTQISNSLFENKSSKIKNLTEVDNIPIYKSKRLIIKKRIQLNTPKNSHDMRENYGSFNRFRTSKKTDNLNSIPPKTKNSISSFNLNKSKEEIKTKCLDRYKGCEENEEKNNEIKNNNNVINNILNKTNGNIKHSFITRKKNLQKPKKEDNNNSLCNSINKNFTNSSVYNLCKHKSPEIEKNHSLNKKYNNNLKNIFNFSENSKNSNKKSHYSAIKSININVNLNKDNNKNIIQLQNNRNDLSPLLMKDILNKNLNNSQNINYLASIIDNNNNRVNNSRLINNNQNIENNSNNNIINFHINYFNSIFGKNNFYYSNSLINNKLEDLLSNNNIYNFNLSDYIIIKQIGKGAFGQIFLVEGMNHEFYALKKIIATNLKDIKSLEHEYKLLFDLNQTNKNLNLVKIHGMQTKILDPTTYVIYVLMDLANEDWEKEILNRQKINKFYSEKELITIIISLISTFADLQRQNISHRDIKPQNILIFEDKNYNKFYKLADFGEAKELINYDKPTERQTLRGTELYMSPILFHALRSKKIIKYIKHNTYKSDLFSFGLCCLFAATLTFDSLYDVREIDNNDKMKNIINGYLSKKYSKNFIEIIFDMLELDENNRKDFIEIEKNIKNYNSDNVVNNN